MSELTVSLLRLSYLLALWLFVLAVVSVLRRDIYGTRIIQRGRHPGERRGQRGRSARVAAPAAVGAAGDLAGFPGHFEDDAGTRLPGSPRRSDGPRPAGASARRPADPDLATRLAVTSGPLRGTTLPLGANGVLIGRSSAANLILDDEFTSGHHAQIVPDAGGWRLEDLGSTNGTFLGREQVTGSVPVRIGQSIRIGQTRLELQR
ncbi:MAG: FHA domain-containing protein [Bifidobacteriaceae bacterium]|jgi:hypothetical protein|nr:FHA domain-containing protein [Bifidobacteriaceae bacterium]